jgi:hypothetical protein
MIVKLCLVGALVAGALVTTHATAGAADAVQVSRYGSVEHRIAAGDFGKIYDPSIGEPVPFYINDHTVVRGPDGTWHLFGITHAEPAAPEDEDSFAHATAPTLHGPWTKQPPALFTDPSFGESHLWAPYVVHFGGRYYMFYAGGGPDSTKAEISVATSPDLWHWTRATADPLFRDGYDARDPFVMRLGNRWVMYYDATSDPAGGHHIVAYRESTDLIHWGARQVAFTDPSTGTFGGPTESPFVVKHGGHYYLFLGPRGGYVGTDVFVSDNPLAFSPDALVGHVASHALEVVQDTDGAWYVTSAGWGQGGVYLAPLDWDRRVVVSGAQVSTASYRVDVQFQPAAQIVSYAMNTPAGWRDLLDTSLRGTVPYLGVGGFGDTDRPGGAVAAEWSADGLAVQLRGIPMGRQPVTLDWSLSFAPGWFDSGLTWQVTGAMTGAVFEVGWSLDTSLPRVGDEAGLDRSGDVAGFSHWTLSGDDRVSLVAAYRENSAEPVPAGSPARANHWFDPPEGALSWQSLWAAGGAPWPIGNHAGGAWRIGSSNVAGDTAYADALYAGLNG